MLILRLYADDDRRAENIIDSSSFSVMTRTTKKKSLSQFVSTAVSSSAIISSTSPVGQNFNSDIKAYKDCIDWGIISSPLHIRAIIHILIEPSVLREP
jgi:hypothetical protein